jgi:hypothetical protein
MTNNDRTDFDLLEDSDGRQFLKLFTGKSNYILEMTDDELDALRARLNKPPTPF